MKPETDIERWERYLQAESERLGDAGIADHDEIIGEIDRCLDKLIKLGRFPVNSQQERIDNTHWEASFD